MGRILPTLEVHSMEGNLSLPVLLLGIEDPMDSGWSSGKADFCGQRSVECGVLVSETLKQHKTVVFQKRRGKI